MELASLLVFISEISVFFFKFLLVELASLLVFISGFSVFRSFC